MEPQIKTIGQALPKSISAQASATMIEKFKAVELTAVEREAAILEAQRDKFFRLEDERMQNEKLFRLQDAKRMWTADEQFAAAQNAAVILAQQSGKVHRMDDFAKPVFEILSWYFTKDERFLSALVKAKDSDEMVPANYSFTKGILIRGNVGVGKTDMLKSFAKNKRICYLPVSCIEIETKCRKRGVDYWETYAGYVPGHGGTIEEFLQPNVGWMFDDLGTEETIPDYGRRFDPVEKIISQRYMVKDKLPFHTLHISTNLNFKMMEDRYGTRFVSRVREMFNIISLEGVDRRNDSK